MRCVALAMADEMERVEDKSSWSRLAWKVCVSPKLLQEYFSGIGVSRVKWTDVPSIAICLGLSFRTHTPKVAVSPSEP